MSTRWIGLGWIAALVLAVGAAWAAEEEPPPKRVAVLAFEDKSGFDSSTGCGCLPLGPLGKLFGNKQTWNLESGFRDMLQTTLEAAYGYEPVPATAVDQALAELGVSPKKLYKRLEDPTFRRTLAERLNADVLLVGTIRKFKQERARGLYRRDIRGGTAASSRLLSGGVGAVGVMGAYYTASIQVDVTAYNRSGGELLADRISESRSYQSGGVLSGPIEANISSEGTRVFISNEEVVSTRKERPPVVAHEILEHVRFGTRGWDRPAQPGEPPNYRDTLLGRVTQQVMDRIVAELRDQIGPPLPGESAEEAERPTAEGNVPFVLEESGDIFVNLGSDVGLRPGDRLAVYRPGEEIRDLETGEVLGTAERQVGLLEVVEVLRPKLSRARLLEGEAQRGDIVRTLQRGATRSEPPSGKESP